MLDVSNQVAIVGVYTAVLTFLLGVLIPVRHELNDAYRRQAANMPVGNRPVGVAALLLLVDGAQVTAAGTLVLCLAWFGALLLGWAPFAGTVWDGFGLRVLTALTLAIFLAVLAERAAHAWTALERLRGPRIEPEP